MAVRIDEKSRSRGPGWGLGAVIQLRVITLLERRTDPGKSFAQVMYKL